MALLSGWRGAAQRLIDGALAIATTRLEIAALEFEAQLRALARLWWLASLALLLGLAALALGCAAALLAVDAVNRPALAAAMALVCLALALACAARVHTAVKGPWLAALLTPSIAANREHPGARAGPSLRETQAGHCPPTDSPVG